MIKWINLLHEISPSIGVQSEYIKQASSLKVRVLAPENVFIIRTMQPCSSRSQELPTKVFISTAGVNYTGV